jgi:hypothetical protein
MARVRQIWIAGHWRSHPPNSYGVRHRQPVWVHSYWRFKAGDTRAASPQEPERRGREWYRKQARRVHRAFANDFDNQARLARYHRRDGLQVDTATGEIIEPAPEGVKEKALTFVLGERKPKGAPTRTGNYGQRALGLTGWYFKNLPRGRVFKKVLAVVAVMIIALLAWRGVTYTMPMLEAQEATREAVIEHVQERNDYLDSLSPEEQEAEKWKGYYEEWGK